MGMIWMEMLLEKRGEKIEKTERKEREAKKTGKKSFFSFSTRPGARKSHACEKSSGKLRMTARKNAAVRVTINPSSGDMK